MSRSDEDPFRIRPAAPKSRTGPRSQRFVSQVLRQVSKTGAKSAKGGGGRPVNGFGRGRVAASLAGRHLGPNARRVIVKSRFVVLRRASPNSVAVHLRYIEREGVTRDGQKGRAYGADTDAADLEAFQARGRDDRHQFRFIVSTEDGLELEDLKAFTRKLMARMESDLETRLDWVAVDHWDTDNPHTHIVLNGHVVSRGRREDLVIAPDYMAHGMRLRASEIVTEWLGPRTEAEISRSLLREVDQERLTSLDRALIRDAGPDGVDLSVKGREPHRQNALRGRLQRLEAMGLAKRTHTNRWRLQPNMAEALDVMGQREDRIENTRRALRGERRDFVVDGRAAVPVIGRIAGKGMVDELQDRAYLVVDSIDGRAHYLELPAGVDLQGLPLNGIVEVKPPGQERAVDRAITHVASAGLYETSEHLAQLRRAQVGEPQTTVDVHVRRLEALRRAGIVERVADGVWRVPPDLPLKAKQHDAQAFRDLSIELRSHLSVAQQVQAPGATWLDRQLVGAGGALAGRGFGSEAREAMQGRVDFLVAEGLAQRLDRRVILARGLIDTLRSRDLLAAGQALAKETGKSFLPAGSGQRVSGTYTRNVLLSSGRFAMLESDMGFTLVPWRPVVERRLGQQVSALIRGPSVDYQIGRGKAIGL